MKRVAVIYWSHFTVATISHFFAITIPVGAVELIVINNTLGFFIKCLLLGVVFYSTIFTVNHITNDGSFCLLNHLENVCRKQAGMEEVPDNFMPRYYGQWKKWFNYLFKRK